MTNTPSQATGRAQTSAPFRLPAPMRWLDRVEEWLSVAFLGVVLIAVSTQVIARYVFEAPLFWGDELARYSYVWMTFTAGTFITGRRSHVAIGMFDKRLSEKWLRVMECFAMLVVAFTCIALVYYSYPWLLKTIRPKSSALRMPMVFLYGAVWLAFAIMALHSLVNFYYVATGRAPALQQAGDTYE
jgi:TRAP-type C4-dicarboxylate transport system permease small subunit